jgi:glycosyltransferase involved in cell wall biosynthesis
MMRIALDASRTTATRVTGTERYSLRLLQSVIARGAEAHTFTLYFREPPPDDLFPAGVRRAVIPFPRLWTHVRFAAALWRDRPDVTWVTAHTLPIFFPGKAIVTVHDLGYLHFPQAHPARQRLYLDLTTRFSARRADLIFADSAATRSDLTRWYGIPESKVHVVYPGVDAPSVGDMAAVRRRYNLPERYFLFLGTLQPRKNIARLAQAYAQFRQQYPQAEIALVLAGGRGWLYDESWTADIPGVIQTGYIDDADRGALYAGALAFVFPSLYEGFGFPVLEAMHCGTPVLCSATSSLPELVGDAALTVDPLDVDAISAGMARLAADADLRADLRERGRARAAAFTWDAAAERALALIAELA